MSVEEIGQALFCDPLERQFDAGQIELILQLGLLWALFLDPTEQAVSFLEKSAAQSSPEISKSALCLLELLSKGGNKFAVSALFKLDVHDNNPTARALISEHRFSPPSPALLSAHLFLDGRKKEFLSADPELLNLTEQFFTLAPQQSRHFIEAALNMGLTGWAGVVAALLENSSQSYLEQVKSFNQLQINERALMVLLLKKSARQGNALAVESLCDLVLIYDHPEARLFLLANNLTPAEPIKKALFLFLTDQWERYNSIDFNRSFLTMAYETADPPLRRRILAQSRFSGQVDWLQNLSSFVQQRYLGEMDDLAWAQAKKFLEQNKKWNELWRLVFSAPPEWGCRFIKQLADAGWRPPDEEEYNLFNLLVNQAEAALATPLKLEPSKSCLIPTDFFSCLAVSQNGKLLAAGCGQGEIFIYQSSNLQRNEQKFKLPHPVIRTMAFSPDNQYLVASCGDNILRVLRLSDSSLIKSIQGHTGLVKCMGFSPDSRVLFSAGFDGTIQSWRFPTGSELRKIFESNEEIFSLGISPDGEYLFSAGAGRSIRMFSTRSSAPVKQLEGPIDTSTSISVSPDAEFILAYSRDNTFHLWNYQSGLRLASYPARGPVSYLSFLPGGKFYIAGGRNRVSINKLLTGEESAQINLGDQVTGIVPLPKNIIVLAQQNGPLKLFDLSVIDWVSHPVATAGPDTLSRVETFAGLKHITRSEKNWLDFLTTLLRWLQRFDIQILDTLPIQAGEFDILL